MEESQAVLIGGRPSTDDRLSRTLAQFGQYLSASSHASYMSCYQSDSQPLYKTLPQGVLKARDLERFKAAIVYLIEQAVPLRVRGGATGLNGGAAGGRSSVVLLTSHLRKVIQYCAHSGVVEVEPGLSPAALNQLIAADGWWLPCEMESEAVATLGGCVMNGVVPFRSGRGPGIASQLIGGSWITGAGEEQELDPAVAWGSEGALGVATRLQFQLLPRPDVRSVWSGQCSYDEATRRVADLSRYSSLCSAEWSDGLLVLRLCGERWRVDALARELGESLPARTPTRLPSVLLHTAGRLSPGEVARLAEAAQVEASCSYQLLRPLTRLALTTTSDNRSQIRLFISELANVLAARSGGSIAIGGSGAFLHHYLPPFFSETELAYRQRLQQRYDPRGLLSDHMVIPEPGRCMERRWVEEAE